MDSYVIAILSNGEGAGYLMQKLNEGYELKHSIVAGNIVYCILYSEERGESNH